MNPSLQVLVIINPSVKRRDFAVEGGIEVGEPPFHSLVKFAWPSASVHVGSGFVVIVVVVIVVAAAAAVPSGAFLVMVLPPALHGLTRRKAFQ